MQHIRIGSRGSDLALWQANHVKKQLEALGSSVEIKIIVTQGDAIQNLSFDKLEGKGFFTKEIETALLNNEIDLAVHSHKDLETEQPKGLIVAAVSEREDPADLLLIRKEKVDSLQLWSLIEKSIIGTSSARRKSQVRGFRPDAEIKDLRGNVPTRIQKLRDGHYDAILLAKAGVDRLKIDLTEFHVERLDPEEFIPAPAQGVLALQIREGDQELLKFLAKMNHTAVQERIAIERKVLNLLQGGCQLPLGVFCADNGIVFVSHCQNWEDGANWFEYETDDYKSLPEIIVEDLTSMQD
ncbi:MAG: hydroxymethylbilane synthase [Flavobacteriia bacterium]|jgi:hydroxymethylbilane synthase